MEKDPGAYIRALFASGVELKPEEIFGNDWTLAQVMQQSHKLHNSVDLMEVFARVAHHVKRDFGVKVRLPAFPLDTPVSVVLDSFLSELQQVSETVAQATVEEEPALAVK